MSIETDPLALAAEARGENYTPVTVGPDSDPRDLAALARGATTHIAAEPVERTEPATDAPDDTPPERPRPPHSTDTPLPPDDRPLITDQRSQGDQTVTRMHRPPEIPTGIALPASTEPAVEGYHAKREAYDAARDDLARAKADQTRATKEARRARIEAVETGREPPPIPAESSPERLARRVAECEENVAAHRVVIDRAGTEATAALRSAAPEVRASVIAQFFADRDRAAELVRQAQAACGVVLEDLFTLGHVDRVYVRPRVPTDVIVQPPGDEPHRRHAIRAEGNWLGDVLARSGEDLRNIAPALHADQVLAWLADQPVSLDDNVIEQLAPYLADDDREADEQDTKARKTKR